MRVWALFTRYSKASPRVARRAMRCDALVPTSPPQLLLRVLQWAHQRSTAVSGYALPCQLQRGPAQPAPASRALGRSEGVF